MKNLITDEEFNLLEDFNSKYNIKLAKKLIKKLNFKKDIPQNKIVFVKRKSKIHIHWFKQDTEEFTDEWEIKLSLNKKNKVVLTKYYTDMRDYGLSCYVEFQEFNEPTELAFFNFKTN
jgi:hypothetical protein